MTKTIKNYVDIEIAYIGNITSNKFFRDYDNFKFEYGGVLGILSLEIDTENKSSKERWFKQITTPKMDEIFGIDPSNAHEPDNNVGILPTTQDNQIMVTWNGRDFDIPILLKNIASPSIDKSQMFKNIIKRDRDLIDICVKRYGNVKGGLPRVTYDLGIDYEPPVEDIEIGETRDAYRRLYFTNYQFTGYEGIIKRGNSEYLKHLNNIMQTDWYKKDLKLSMMKNEWDIRVLPLLEEKLGLLYEPLTEEDKYHRNW